MLDVISDFWKPAKKVMSDDTVSLSGIGIGSELQFDFVPQAQLSGKTFTVQSINSYDFDGDVMVSYVLGTSQDDEVASLILAGEGEETYLAISRRVPFNERNQIFDTFELDAAIRKSDVKKLQSRDIPSKWRSWVVDSYKKEIEGTKGRFLKGFRAAGALPDGADTHTFNYYLFTSESNEFAIEIEKYTDGRLEMFATIYRQVSDITYVSNKEKKEDKPLSNGPTIESVPTEVSVTPEHVEAQEKSKDSQVLDFSDTQNPDEKKENTHPATFEAAISEAMAIEKQEDVNAEVVSKIEKTLEHKEEDIIWEDDPTSEKENDTKVADNQVAENKEETKEIIPQEKPVEASTTATSSAFQPYFKELPTMAPTPAPSSSSYFSSNGANEAAKKDMATELTGETRFGSAYGTSSGSPASSSNATPAHTASAQPQSSYTPTTMTKGEVKTVPIQQPNGEMENDSIECELRVANKVIDEAIRNEMRLSDVVRRIIALPVAQQEIVQIPISLSEEDFKLLAIRYGMSASEHNDIKKRIIEELNDFSGNGK